MQIYPTLFITNQQQTKLTKEKEQNSLKKEQLTNKIK